MVAGQTAMRRTSHGFVTATVPFAAGGHVLWFVMDDLVRSVTEELRWDPRIDAGPARGEHTDSVLKQLGYSSEQINDLRAVGAL